MPTITQDDHDRLDLASGYPDAGYGVRIWSTTALVALAAQREAHEAKLAALAEPAPVPAPPPVPVQVERGSSSGLWRNLALAALLAMSVASLVLLLKIYNQGMRAQISRTEIGAPTAAMAILSPTPSIVAKPAVRIPAEADAPQTATATTPAKPASTASPRRSAARAAPDTATLTADAGSTARSEPEAAPVPATIADTFPPPADEPRTQERKRVRTSGIDALHLLRMR